MRVPDAAGSITVEANLKTQQVITNVDLDAPREGRPVTRVNWLLRQLSQAPDGLRLTSSFAKTRETSSVLLSEARESAERLLNATDGKREIRTFEIAMTRTLGGKTGRGKGSFVADTRQQVIDFYSDVVLNLTSWPAKAPKLPPVPQEVPASPQPDPPPFVAASERERGEASLPDDVGEADASESPGGGTPKPWEIQNGEGTV